MVPEKPAHMYLSYNEAMLLFKDVQKRIIASQSADSEYSKNKEAHEAEVRMIKARSRCPKIGNPNTMYFYISYNHFISQLSFHLDDNN